MIEPQRSEESGQIMVLVIGYVLLTLLVVCVVTAVSAVYLEAKRLLSLADSTAAVAVEGTQLTSDGAAPHLRLDNAMVTAAAELYLERAEVSERFDQLEISTLTGSPDGRSARVVLTAVVHPPLISFLLPEGIQISAESVSRPQLSR
ncbi:pilus assembly protein TadG-related protein [Psychromicrobium sp. YIM B11713]|uniref:pilus assembly protein TadG-related protein n=1 Tax=Psychromicrobium sp. YIM B11713 TaxID=3145233 RepID=UPI00374FDBB2